MDNLNFNIDEGQHPKCTDESKPEPEPEPVQVVIFDEFPDVHKPVINTADYIENSVGTDNKQQQQHNFNSKVCTQGELSEKAEKKCWERFLGMALMTLASTMFSLNVAIVKNFKGYQVYSFTGWILFGGCFLLSIPVLMYIQFVKGTRPFQTIYPWSQKDNLKTFCTLCVRTLVGSVSIVFQYSALQYLSMSDTTVICLSTPVFVTFLGCIVLGEMFGMMNIVATVVTLIGVVIITRPPFLTGEREMDTHVMVGVGLALASMTFAAFVFVSLRLLKHVNFAVITFSFGLVGSAVCFILSEIFGSFEFPRSLWDLLLASISSVLIFAGQAVMTAAFKFEDAGPLSLIRSFDVIFSFIWQAIFFSVEPDKYSIIGALVVLSGVILIGFRKHISSLPVEHPWRKMCCLILK